MKKKRNGPKWLIKDRYAFEGPMYRYHRLLLEARSQAQAELWFREFLRMRKGYDRKFK